MSSTPEQVEIPVPAAEIKLLSAVQRALLAVPGATRASLTLSHVGEHALDRIGGPDCSRESSATSSDRGTGHHI